MKSILSFPLYPESCQDVMMPGGASALSVELVGSRPTIFVLAEQGEPMVEREVVVILEGLSLPPDLFLDEYVGSVNMAGGSTILHVFLKKN